MKRFLVASLASVLLCSTVASAVENPFSDVSSDSDLAQSVLWALENGITSGTTDTTFSPDTICTRGQVVTFLWRAKGEPTPTITENPFSDVAETSAFYTAILWAVGEGITTGYSDGTFRPSTNCTSGQVVTFLYRAMGEPETTYESAYAEDAATAYVSAINWADETGLLDGMDFAVSDASPRSDIVTYLYRDAGSPDIEITEPEPPTYTYTMPEVQEPGTPTISAEYFEQLFLYMLVNQLESYDCYFSGVSGYTLEAQGMYTIVNDACFYIKDSYVDLGGYYAGYNCNWIGTSSATTVTVTLVPQDITHSEAVTYRTAFISDVETLVASFFARGELSESDSDYTKALYFYRWCALNLQYDTKYNSASYYGYGALTNKTGVCQGYVSIFNAMCNVAGIEAYGVSGTAASGENHIWSCVNLDGTWLYADPTYGDPIPNTVGYCDDSYFAMTKTEMAQLHTFGSNWA